MLRAILSRLRLTQVSPATPKAPQPKATMSDGEITAAITLVRRYQFREVSPWINIPKVKCPVKFMGWGYVVGRTRALKVNSRVMITEADDDMDFTEYCVLLDGVPTLLIMFRQNMYVTVVTEEEDFMAVVLNTNAMKLNNLDDFKALPVPVRKVMHDVLRHSFMELKDRKTNAYDQLISY